MLIVDRGLSRSELLEVIRKFIEDLENVGLIVVQDDLRPFFEQLSKVITMPQIIYLPSMKYLDKSDVRGYYLNLLKHYLGISLEV